MRVVLMSERPALRDALYLFLRGNGIEVVGDVADASHLSARSSALGPDVVLVDWRPSDAASAKTLIDAIAELKQGDASPRIIALIASGGSTQAHAAGVDAHTTLGDRPEDLLTLLTGTTQTYGSLAH
ncbi:MAG: hypothetical protein WCJ13_10300 [Coriobacteriia bacterium]